MAYPLFAWRNAVWSAQRIAIALPVECVFSDASKTTILLWNGIACFYSFEKKKKETSNHGATYEKPRKKMEKYTSIAGHVFKSARFRESFDDPSFIKISTPFHILDNYIISLISFDISKSLYHFLPTYKFQKTKKKKRRTDIELNRLAFQSFRLSSTIERKKKREREKERENRRRQRDFGN